MAAGKRRGLGTTYVDEIFDAPKTAGDEAPGPARKPRRGGTRRRRAEEPVAVATASGPESAETQQAQAAPAVVVEAARTVEAEVQPCVETTAQPVEEIDDGPVAVPAGAETVASGPIVETMAEVASLPLPWAYRTPGPLVPRLRETVQTWVDLVGEARAAVGFLSERYPGAGLMGLCESALRRELQRLRREYNHGRPFVADAAVAPAQHPEPARA